MRIITVGQRNSGVSFHRLFNPLIYLPKDYAMMTDVLTEEELEKGYDILFINRYIAGMEVDEVVRLREKYGFKLVVDVDDYWNLDAWHILYGKYPTQKVIDHIKVADIVTCSNNDLAVQIDELNPNWIVIPNALPYGEDQFTDVKTESDKVRFVYAGSITHEKDIAILKNPMKRVAGDAMVKSKSSFILCGYSEDKNVANVWGRMINDYLCGFNVDGYIRAALPVDEYMNFYNEADACLIPLVDSKFNSMKSNLKVLEAATKNAPVICSNVKPYSECKHIIPINNQSDWFTNIKKVVKDAIYRQEMGIANGEWCRENFNLIKVNKIRSQIFEALCQ
jgi:glycosyltransferase involved in cell wall biosynthesis